ncbi:MAG: GvpL/GvpF family gas vesicle protein, partial [Planctomycetes bacterium]|nr:GvpL/GvpF family gas vesicle protein [Planctomycetota bacterium]
MSNHAASRAQATDEPMGAQQTAAKSGRCLYAMVYAAQAGLCDGLVGVAEGPVYAISEGQVAAVVSDVPNKRIRPERRHLAAHQGILRALSEEAAVLPMAFGTIADGEESIRTILRSNQDDFLAQLRRVEGKVEMGLKVVWAVPNIFEYFVGFHAPLRELR